MTPQRWMRLEMQLDEALTVEEMREGWHFCDEFDGLCTQGELFLESDPEVCLCGFDKRKLDPKLG